jgi:hypothetical protein
LKGSQAPSLAFFPGVRTHLLQLAVLAEKQLLQLVPPELAVLQGFAGGVKVT